MTISGSRDRVESSQENKQITDTAKALIVIYKSAFGKNWYLRLQANGQIAGLVFFVYTARRAFWR